MVSRVPDDGSLGAGRDPTLALFEELKQRLTSQEFKTWLEGTPCTFHPPDRFVFTAPNRFRKAWMEKHFRDVVRTCARHLFEFEMRIEFDLERSDDNGSTRSLAAPLPLDGAKPSTPSPRSTSSSPDSESASISCLLPQKGASRIATTTRDSAGSDAPTAMPSHRGTASRADTPHKDHRSDALRSSEIRPLSKHDLLPEFLFETFVVGPSNQLAHAAAIAVCDDPATAYNPLFLYGSSGVGKTHLLRAICHRVFSTKRLRVLYLPSQEFLCRFVDSITTSRGSLLRQTLQQGDLLILDDFQFFAGRSRTQEELFQIINSFLDRGKQVIISSRNSPRDCIGVHPRLSSRFQAGLVAKLEMPTPDLRVAILRSKARAKRIELSKEVAEHIEKVTPGGIRELEGALIRSLHEASDSPEGLTLEKVRIILEADPESSSRSGAVTVPQILKAVQEYYRLKPRDLISRSKVRSLVLPRQVAMFLSRELTEHSLNEIAGHFSAKNHTTVIYAQGRILKLLETSNELRVDLQLLRERIESLRGN